MFSANLRPFVVAFAGLLLAACASGSRYQGMTARQLHALAQEQVADEEYGDAAETLETLLLTFPGFEQAAEAQMLLARAYYEDEKYVTAQAEYRRFLDRHPTHPEAVVAAMGMCRSAEALSPIPQRDQSFTEQALQICLETAQTYPGTPQADEAAQVAEAMRDKLAKKTYDTGGYYLRRGFHHSAILYFDLVLEEHPTTPWAPRALVGIIEAYRELGYDDEVEAARARLLERYPDSPEARQMAGGGDPGGLLARWATGG